MNASFISSNHDSGPFGLEPELKKGMEYHNVAHSSPAKVDEKVSNLKVAFRKVVFYDDLGITLNE